MEVLNIDVSGLKCYTKQVGFYDIPNMEITIRKWKFSESAVMNS